MQQNKNYRIILFIFACFIFIGLHGATESKSDYGSDVVFTTLEYLNQDDVKTTTKYKVADKYWTLLDQTLLGCFTRRLKCGHKKFDRYCAGYFASLFASLELYLSDNELDGKVICGTEDKRNVYNVAAPPFLLNEVQRDPFLIVRVMVAFDSPVFEDAKKPYMYLL